MIDLVVIRKKWISDECNEKNLRRFQSDLVINKTIKELDTNLANKKDVHQNLVELINRFDYLETFSEVENPYDFSKTLHYILGEGWNKRDSNSGRELKEIAIKVNVDGYKADYSLKLLIGMEAEESPILVLKGNGYTPKMFDDIWSFFLKNYKSYDGYKSNKKFAHALRLLPAAEKLGRDRDKFIAGLKQSVLESNLEEFVNTIGLDYRLLIQEKPVVTYYKKAEKLGINRKIATELLRNVSFELAYARLDICRLLNTQNCFTYYDFREMILNANDSKTTKSVGSIVERCIYYSKVLDKSFLLEKVKELGESFDEWITNYAYLLEKTGEKFTKIVVENSRDFPFKTCHWLYSIFHPIVHIGELDNVREAFMDYLEEESFLRKLGSHKYHGMPIIEQSDYQHTIYERITALYKEGHKLNKEHIRKMFDLLFKYDKSSLITTSKPLKVYLGII